MADEQAVVTAIVLLKTDKTRWKKRREMPGSPHQEMPMPRRVTPEALTKLGFVHAHDGRFEHDNMLMQDVFILWMFSPGTIKKLISQMEMRKAFHDRVFRSDCTIVTPAPPDIFNTKNYWSCPLSQLRAK